MDQPPRRSLRVRAALGGVVVLALIGVGAAVLSTALTPGGQTTVLPGAAGGAGSSGSGGSSGAGAGASGDAGDALLEAEVVVVHVLGAVREPGIVELPLGSRVVDAVAAARGPTDDADLAGVNLARVLVDGEQLVVPRIGEVPAAGAGGAGGAGGGAGGSSGATDAQGRVNINLADATALETLPGVGPALAGRIIAWREQNGPFRSVDELTAVAGIGEKTLAGFRDQATV